MTKHLGFSLLVLFSFQYVNAAIDNLVCEDKSMHLECPHGEVIHVLEALYGRERPELCYNEKNVTNCRARNALGLVKARCDFKSKCDVKASNDIFGDPCQNVEKYLEVRYECVRAINNLVCENETMSLECPSGQVINILQSFYGKEKAELCYKEQNVNNCRAENTLSPVKARCDLRRKCEVMASNDIFGDPCKDVGKYLEVYYECVRAHYIQKVACEFDNLKLQCCEGFKIRIVEAFYGRMNSKICALEGKNIHSLSCSAQNPQATEVAAKECDDKSSCTLPASNKLFGDPCVNIYKYLEVGYVCVPA